jgi:hypothetical protein
MISMDNRQSNETMLYYAHVAIDVWQVESSLYEFRFIKNKSWPPGWHLCDPKGKKMLYEHTSGEVIETGVSGDYISFDGYSQSALVKAVKVYNTSFEDYPNGNRIYLGEDFEPLGVSTASFEVWHDK